MITFVDKLEHFLAVCLYAWQKIIAVSQTGKSKAKQRLEFLAPVTRCFVSLLLLFSSPTHIV